jgi:hypothetical protein
MGRTINGHDPRGAYGVMKSNEDSDFAQSVLWGTAGDEGVGIFFFFFFFFEYQLTQKQNQFI